MIRNEKTRALFLSALMVLSIFGGAVAFTGTVAAADSGSDGLDAQSNHNTAADWSLDNPDIDVVRGNLAEFDVSFNDTNASEAYLVIGRETDNQQTSYGYELNLTISDDTTTDSESGTVVFNTYEAGSVTGNVPPVTAEGGINVTIEDERANTAGVIQPTTDANGDEVRAPYPIRFGTVSLDQAYTNPNTTGGMDLLARDGVNVNPSVETWTGPASTVPGLMNASGQQILDNASALTTTDDAPSGAITRDDELTQDWDALVYEIEVAGIQGYLETTQVSTQQAFINQEALSLIQRNPFFNQPPKELDLGYNSSGLSIQHVEGTDTYFVVANVDELNLSRNTNQGRISFGPPQTGESYNVDFSIEDQIGGMSASDDPTSFISADFEYNPANINNDDEYEIRIQETFEVSGSTELAPGTELEIVLQNKAGQTPTFGYTNSTTVDENGEFSVTYTGPQATGTEFELLINATAHPTAPTRSKDGLFREQPTANVTFDNQTRIGGDLVVINQTDLSDGGYIAIHEDNASGPIIGSSKLLPPGSQNNLPIALDYNKTITENTTLVAMPHFDRPGDGFFRFNATTGNDSFYYLTQPVDPGDLPPEGQRTPVTDSAEITFIPQEQQEVTRTVIRTVPVDVTRTVEVPVTRTVEVPVEVTRTVIDERTVEVPVNVTRTVEVPVEVTRTVEVPVNVTQTVTREVTRTVEVTRIVNQTSTPGQPGMGALVAVIALLAASLLAVRRRDW